MARSPFFQRLRRGAWELIRVLAPALLIALFVNVYVAQAVAVKEGPSMQPNLYIGYRVMTEEISCRFHPPRRGDIVVVDPPAAGAALIKRVVGLPGDVVRVTRGHTWINGELLDEPWVAYFGGMDYGSAPVPPGHLFTPGRQSRPVVRLSGNRTGADGRGARASLDDLLASRSSVPVALTT